MNENEEEKLYCVNCIGVEAVEIYDGQLVCQKCWDHYQYMDYLSSRNE